MRVVFLINKIFSKRNSFLKKAKDPLLAFALPSYHSIRLSLVGSTQNQQGVKSARLNL